MSNGIKFDPQESGALRIGNANIAVRKNSVSNTSSYWTSIEPINGGYTVYIDKSENGPAIYTPNNDSELIGLANKLSGETFADVNAALVWFNSYEPGNRNYIRNYPNWGRLGGFIYDSLDDSINIYNVPNYYNHSESNVINLIDNTIYTLNVEVPLVVGSCMVELQSRPDGAGYNAPVKIYLVEGTNIFTFNSGFLPVGFTHYTLRFFGVNDTTSVTVKITKIKLEKGSTVTPWRAAMEDPDYVPDKFVLSSEISPIVTNGLVLNYDAGLIPSYPRGGTAINDVSGNGNNGTLVNGVGYSSDGGGSLSFDGVDDSVYTPSIDLTNTNKCSISFWFKTNKLSAMMLGEFSRNFNNFNGTITIYMNEPGSGIIYYGNRTSLRYNVIRTTKSYNDNKWHHIVCITDKSLGASQNKMYVDGELDYEQHPDHTYISTDNFGNFPFYVGSRGNNSLFYSGNISDFNLYNRALTSSEILQNYYAGLQKFIPKDGLVLSLSPQNTIGGYPLIARDLSGNGNNGTLVNGVSVAKDGGGSWKFDGVNDYIGRTTVDDDSLDINTITISMCVKPISVSTLSYLISKNTTGGAADQQYSIYYEEGGAIVIVLNGVAKIPGYTLEINKWTHIVLTYNGTNWYFYTNGVNTNNGSLTETLTFKPNFSIGRRNDGYYFNGNIGQTLIYNRALTSDEISTIYQSTESKYNIYDTYFITKDGEYFKTSLEEYLTVKK